HCFCPDHSDLLTEINDTRQTSRRSQDALNISSGIHALYISAAHVQSLGKRYELTCPDALWIAGANDTEFFCAGGNGFGTVRGKAQRPAGLFLNFRDTATGMIGLQQSFAGRGVEGEDSQCGNQRGWTAAWESLTLAPTAS